MWHTVGKVFSSPFQWYNTSPQIPKVSVGKSRKTNLQLFSDYIALWSKEPQLENYCGSFSPCFLLVFGFCRHKIKVTTKCYSFMNMYDFMPVSHRFLTHLLTRTIPFLWHCTKQSGMPLISLPMREFKSGGHGPWSPWSVNRLLLETRPFTFNGFFETPYCQWPGSSGIEFHINCELAEILLVSYSL